MQNLYWLTIRQNSDGLERKKTEPEYGEWEDNEDGHTEFLWSDGNYACDCNRQLFWNRIAAEPDESLKLCSQHLYSVKLTDKDGNILYSDYDVPEKNE